MDNSYTEKLEGVIKQMLTPLKSVPLNLVVESLSGYKIKKFDKNDKKDINTLKTLEELQEKHPEVREILLKYK